MINRELPKQLTDDKMAAKALGICVATLHNWRKKGKIPYYKIGGTYRYCIEEIIEYTRKEAKGGK